MDRRRAAMLVSAALLLTPADTAAYIVGPDIVERWPRANPPAGCA